jgi:putative ABC transport system permease protein
MLSLITLTRTLSWRYLLRRWDRAVLVTASIALGVATVVSTRMLNQCIETAAHDTTTPLAGAADLYVVNNRGVRLDLAGPLRKVPGVRSVQPILVDRVQLTDLPGRSAILLGVDVKALAEEATRSPGGADAATEMGVRWEFTPPLGTLLFGTGKGALVSRALREDLARAGRGANQPIDFHSGGQAHRLVPAGVLDLEGPAARLGQTMLVVDVNEATRLVGQPGLATRFDVALEPGADRGSVQAALERAAGGKAEVKTPESQRLSTDEIIGSLQIGFTLCGLGALVVGLFLVYNALSVSVAERRHEIGVLRSLGATRGQVAGLFTAEAMALGGVGAVLGVPLGAFLAHVALGQIREDLASFFITEEQALRLNPGVLVLAMGAGLATAILAALVPALQAAADEPADAVRRVPSAAGRLFLYLQAGVSLVMAGGGVLMIVFRHALPGRLGGYGGLVLTLVGLLLAMPLFVAVLARLFQPVARRVFGIEARLAADNLTRAPGRTGIVVGALAAGVALMLQTAGVGASNEGPVLDWIDRAVTADLMVCQGNVASAIGSALPMDPKVVADLKELPGVQNVVSIRYGQPDFNGRIVFLIAIDALAYHDTSRAKSRLPHLDLFLRLPEPNTALVSENFAALHHVKAGDTITLQSPNGPVPLKVLGAVQDYSWSRGTILIDRAQYARLFNDRLVDFCHVFLRPDDPAARERVSAAAEAAALAGSPADRGPLGALPGLAAPGLLDGRAVVQTYCARAGLTSISRDELNHYVADVVKRVYRLAYLQQVVVGVVAALGVVTALLISVLQRRRELGLLRAVGATQGQVLHSVLAEAALMGILGTGLGILAGLPMEWYILRILLFEESGFLFPVTVPWKETLIISGLAVGLATLAGLLPALHAVRLRIAEAVAYE